MNLTRSVLERLGHDSLVDLALSLSEELETHQERDEDVTVEGVRPFLDAVRAAWGEAMGKAVDATTFHGTTGTKEPSPRGPRPAQTLLDDDPETDQQGGNTPEADQDRPDVSQDENDSQVPRTDWWVCLDSYCPAAYHWPHHPHTLNVREDNDEHA